MKATAKLNKKRFLASLEKKFGKDIVTFAEDDPGKVDRLPFGIAQLDYLTLGGLPLGKMTMFRGPEGGTKTTMAVIMCARYLERFPDKLAVYIDAEEKYPAQLVKRLGIDRGRFVTASPETAEETIDFVEHALRDKNVGMLVLDSIAAIVPKIEITASAADQQQGVAARAINKMIRKMLGAMKAAKLNYGEIPTSILINQERFRIGVRWGDPTTLPGGEGQKYAVVLSLRFRLLAPRKEDEIPPDAPIIKVGVTVSKHSFGPSKKGAEYQLAMEPFGKLKAGDAHDEYYLFVMCQKLGLITANGDGWAAFSHRWDSQKDLAGEIDMRQAVYKHLKAGMLRRLGERA